MDYWFSAHETANLAADVESTGTRFYMHLQKMSDEHTVRCENSSQSSFRTC